jgi:hypothetical protein
LFFEQYFGFNPTIYASVGETIAFDLGLNNTGFLLKDPTGANLVVNVSHIDVDSTLSLNQNAQGKNKGILYWKVPITADGFVFSYQSSANSQSTGNIVVTSPVPITPSTRLVDISRSGLTFDQFAIPASTKFKMREFGGDYYIDNFYSNVANPNVIVLSGTTVAFNLNTAGNPFIIESLNTSNLESIANITLGLTHVDTDGTLSSGLSAQGKDRGTLYWDVPFPDANVVYIYQNEASFSFGNIIIKDISAI